MRGLPALLLGLFALSATIQAADRKAPAGLFKDVTKVTVGDALLLRGTQLFIDNRLIEKLEGARKQLNRPVKSPKNPILVKDRPWEPSGPGYATVFYDRDEKLFKMWYQMWKKTKGTSTGVLAYATSTDGVRWTKPLVDKKGGTNMVRHPPIQGFQCPGVFKDRGDTDPRRRYKMLFSCNPDGTASTWMTSAAFSADGIHWEPSKQTALIPFSDTQICPFWDQQRRRYVAIMRFGPPNTRIISRVESTDFLHWSPKITVMRRTRMDAVQETQFYQMAPMPYGNDYVGLVGTYHNESLKPIPPDKPWTNRQDLQLVYSRNGITWSRVGGRGTIPLEELNRDKDWSRESREATFVPYGRMNKDWDWGYMTPYFTPEPIIIDDRIHFYYSGSNAKHWWTWTGDPPKKDPNAKPPLQGVGLATLRRDGFVSIEAGPKGGTMTTRPFVFLGDTLELNADARGGSITVEARGSDGKVISGFGRDSSVPITSDNIRHVLAWKGHKDLHQLQGRPIRLTMYLTDASLFSMTPRNRHVHYLQAYD